MVPREQVSLPGFKVIAEKLDFLLLLLLLAFPYTKCYSKREMGCEIGGQIEAILFFSHISSSGVSTLKEYIRRGEGNKSEKRSTCISEKRVFI